MSAKRSEIPFLTSEAMREVDRLMTEELGIDLLQMMENAGRGLAQLCRFRFLNGDVLGRTVTVLAGRGANGGGALACARRLHGWGAHVSVLMAKPIEGAIHATAQQLSAVRRMGLLIDETGLVAADLQADLIVDGLIGYSLRGAPSGRTAKLIESANAHEAPILSLDVPSGMDATTGEAYYPAIEAHATLTLALPKTGLRASGARRYVGELYVADIGVPLEIYSRPTIGLQVHPLFSREDVIRVW